LIPICRLESGRALPARIRALDVVSSTRDDLAGRQIPSTDGVPSTPTATKLCLRRRHGPMIITATYRRQNLYRHEKPRAGNDMQHAMASLRHFACKEMPQSIAATPIAIRLASTRCLDIRAPFRKWHTISAQNGQKMRAISRRPCHTSTSLITRMGASRCDICFRGLCTTWLSRRGRR
jgi:hypothetical protein